MANNWTETCAKHPPAPNAAAMYSCLLKILAEMIDLGGMERGRKACFSPDAIAEEIRQALAVPPRQCDVGTPEAQDKRFDAFCKSYKEHHGNCFGCAALRTSGDCKVSWMQMPYEAKEGDAK